jgi:hypothetical protein
MFKSSVLSLSLPPSPICSRRYKRYNRKVQHRIFTDSISVTRLHSHYATADRLLNQQYSRLGIFFKIPFVTFDFHRERETNRTSQKEYVHSFIAHLFLSL